VEQLDKDIFTEALAIRSEAPLDDDSNPYTDDHGNCDHVSHGSYFDSDTELSYCNYCDVVVDIYPPDVDDQIKSMKEDN
jgi:hypothetical protein